MMATLSRNLVSLYISKLSDAWFVGSNDASNIALIPYLPSGEARLKTIGSWHHARKVALCEPERSQQCMCVRWKTLEE